MRDLLFRNLGRLVMDGKNRVKVKVKEYCPLGKYKKIFMDELRKEDKKDWEYETSFRINLGKYGNTKRNRY